MTPVEKVLALKSKFTEMLDNYKDFVYLFAFKHSFKYLIILIISIVYPVAQFHFNQYGITTFCITHSLMVYLHLTSNPIENEARRGHRGIVAVLENLPQFYVQMREMIEFRYSVNFV